MANQEHLGILKQGVEVWNKWRQEHPEIRPNLRGSNFRRADLSRANLCEADFTEATLNRANLSDTDLRRALFDGASLINANLMRADLSQANLSGSDLRRANLFGAILIGTILHNTDLEEADFSYSELAFTMFGDVDLSVTKGLERVHHVGSSSIGIDTLYRSGGKIPEVFLRSAGVPDSFISNIHSLVSQPIEYYSCFISYSSEDQAFAERLYADLQSVGVRCWFAPVELKVGDNWREKIDEAIRLYDKLLLVLSKYSILSKWVEKEVEIALAKELEQKRTILFPLRLDNSVLESTSQWSAQLSHTKHIGDFRHWQDHDEYQEAFARLIGDLSAAQELGKRSEQNEK